MAYTIQAVIAKTGSFTGAIPGYLHLVPLNGGVEMLPLSTEAIQLHGISFCPLTDEGEVETPPALLKLCEGLSKRETIAYVEAEIFGGAGTQAHIIFSKGKQIGLPVVSDDAINQALRLLGVSKAEAVDEFEAVGLGRYRSTDQWLK